jgi:hypothetical protein
LLGVVALVVERVEESLSNRGMSCGAAAVRQPPSPHPTLASALLASMSSSPVRLAQSDT